MRKPVTHALAALLLLTLPGAQARADAIRLVMAMVYGSHLPGLGEPALDLAKRIKLLSNDTLELDLKQPGEVAQPQEILDKVSQGSIDAGFSTASFWGAKMSAASLFSGFPFGLDATGYIEWFYAGNGLKLYQQMYDQGGYKVHVIPCAFGGAETAGWFAKEILIKDDIKGLRMRIFGLGGRVMSRAGATTVLVPGGTLTEAFDKKQIDAAELYPPAADRRQDLQSHVKLIYAPGWHQPETVLELVINNDKWAALSAQQQTLIETACKASMLTTLASSAKLQREALAELATKDGVRILPLPQDALDAFRAAWVEISREEGEQDAFFKEVLDDLETFRAKSPRSNLAPAAP
ncbi:MAG TPA: C4-dicarboxylate ABC transporter [Methyloceanibacter sp.]|nr:C4-dicarboxylate ABC transporter [Methyloceanibacter sp.]